MCIHWVQLIYKYNCTPSVLIVFMCMDPHQPLHLKRVYEKNNFLIFCIMFYNLLRKITQHILYILDEKILHFEFFVLQSYLRTSVDFYSCRLRFPVFYRSTVLVGYIPCPVITEITTNGQRMIPSVSISNNICAPAECLSIPRPDGI